LAPLERFAVEPPLVRPGQPFSPGVPPLPQRRDNSRLKNTSYRLLKRPGGRGNAANLRRPNQPPDEKQGVFHIRRIRSSPVWVDWFTGKLFEACHVGRRVLDGVLNVQVSEVILNEPHIRALVGRSEAASVGQGLPPLQNDSFCRVLEHRADQDTIYCSRWTRLLGLSRTSVSGGSPEVSCSSEHKPVT
jgi:hypothetical protein